MAKKIAKRGNDEGSIRKRKDKRYEGRITAGFDYVKNKPIRMSVYGDTQKEMLRKLEEIKVKKHTGTFVNPNKLSVAEWFDNWLEIYAKNAVRPSTWDSYETMVRVHIKPMIGQISLQELLPVHLQKLYNQKLESGRVRNGGALSAKTVKYIHVVIHKALKQAKIERLVFENVADHATIPKQKKHEICPLTADELIVFLEAAKGHRFYVPFLVECYTGVRRGELLGLRWRDISFDKKTLSIRNSLIRTRKGLVMSEPKTESSKRTIVIDDEVMNELKALKVKQSQEKLMAGRSYDNSDFVFCNAIGKPIEPRNLTRQFEALLKQANLPRIRFHDLRHSHATLLLMQNVQPKYVQDRLGHSTISTTMDTYSHILPSMQAEASEKVSQALKRR